MLIWILCMVQFDVFGLEYFFSFSVVPNPGFIVDRGKMLPWMIIALIFLCGRDCRGRRLFSSQERMNMVRRLLQLLLRVVLVQVTTVIPFPNHIKPFGKMYLPPSPSSFLFEYDSIIWFYFLYLWNFLVAAGYSVW